MRSGAQRPQADFVGPKQSTFEFLLRLRVLMAVDHRFGHGNRAFDREIGHSLIIGLLHQLTKGGDDLLRLPFLQGGFCQVHLGDENFVRFFAAVGSLQRLLIQGTRRF